MQRMLIAVVLAGALPAFAQETSPPTLTPRPDAAPPRNEIVLPQYTDDAPRPTDAPVVLTPEERTLYERSKLKYVRATADVTIGGLTLERSQFYTIVGRQDLAKESHARTTSRILWITGGSVVAVAGIVSGLVLLGNNDNTQQCTNLGTPFAQCNPVPSTGGTWAGLGLTIGGAVVGAVMIAVGIVTTGPVTTPAEDQQLVERYNRSLLEKLSGKATAPTLTPAVGLSVGSAGGRLELGWHF
jgi:hypothetical protein